MAKRRAKWDVKIGDTNPPPAPAGDTFTNSIENLTSVNGPGGESAENDNSDNDSIAREYLTGLADNGSIEVSGNLNYGAAGQQELRSLQVSGESRNFQIDFIDPEGPTTEETFDIVARVSSYRISAEFPDGTTQFTATLRTSGAGTYS